MSIREQIKAGALTPEERLEVTLTLENGQIHQGEGNLVAPSVAVSTTTGTQDFRFSFANPDGLIRPGMFLRGAVVVGRMQAVRVPQRAATIGRGGVLSVFLAAEGKAVRVQVSPAGSDGNDWLVTEGLEPGAALIVDGLSNLRDGAAVETVPVTIDAQGVVRDAEATAPTAPAAGN